MKNIAWIFEKFKEEDFSEEGMQALMSIVDDFIDEKTREYFNIEAQLQLVQAVKVRLEDKLDAGISCELK